MWKNDSENFVKFTGKQVWWSPFFNNLHFSLKRPQAQVFSWEFHDILQNSATQWWLWWCWWLWIVPVEMVEQRKSLSLISSKDHCQRFSSSQNLSSGFVEWSCTVVITPTPWRHWCAVIETSFMKTWGGPFVISYKLDLTSHFISSARKQPSSMISYSNQQYLNKNWYNLFWKIFLIPFSKQNMLLQVLLCSLCQCKVHLLLYVPRNPIKSERKLFWKIVYDKSFCHLL